LLSVHDRKKRRHGWNCFPSMSYIWKENKKETLAPYSRRTKMSNSVRLRFYDLPSVAVQSAWARIPASHCTALWFCCWKTWSYFRRRWMLLSVLIIRRLTLSLSPCCTLQRRSTRWELCYRSALERRLSTGQKVRLYRGLMLLYKECRKKKERKEKEILVSPSRIAVRFERLQFVFVFYFFILFYFILFYFFGSSEIERRRRR
jgi:hypothetical protein